MPELNERQVNNWAMLCHLSALLFYLGVPLGNFIGPLVVWMAKKRESSFIDENGKESLNFQISVFFCWLPILCSCMLFVLRLMFALGIGNKNGSIAGMFYFGLAFFSSLAILSLILIISVIRASIKVKNGNRFRYPLTIRLIK
jgi:uncharacterized protein